ncbi:MAG TPA: protein tyrosine phosphatase family protein [Polyangiaceae bacterium]|nr:protein tyrosine phosphatase family protein [Polyangiaceae bacterium]
MTQRLGLSGIYNHRAVDDTLGTSGQPTVAQLSEIAAAGYEVIINLSLHDDPRYSLPDERGSVLSLGLEYVHIPVVFQAPDEGELLAFFAAMEASEGKRIWVHCAANMRVSAFLGLFRVIRQGWAHERAFELLRGLWEPDEVWSAFIGRMLEKHAPTTQGF